MLLAPEDVSDYIFQELAPISKMYDHVDSSDTANKRTNILNLHIEKEFDVIPKEAILPFITKTKGLIRRTESSYLEVEGPFYVKQSCFINHNDHFHCEWKVTTMFEDLLMIH